MQILITGATGLIGSALIQKLSVTHQFTALSRRKIRAQRLLPTNVHVIESLEELKSLDTFDAVINLAGEPIADKRWTPAQKAIICESRWQVTQQLVALFNAAKTPPPVFISGSAIGYYGSQQDDPITEEQNQPHKEFTHELCAHWEALANSVSALTRVCTLRTGVVLAPHGGALSKMRVPFKLGLGGKIGSGEQYMSWIHIDDMVRALTFVLNRPNCSGAFNFTAPGPVKNVEFVNAYAQALGRPALFPMPRAILKLLMGEGAELLLNGQRVLPHKLIEAGFQFKFNAIESAFAHLESTR